MQHGIEEEGRVQGGIEAVEEVEEGDVQYGIELR